METGTKLAMSWAAMHENQRTRNLRCIDVFEQIACGHTVEVSKYEDWLVKRATELGFEIKWRHDAYITLGPRKNTGWFEV